jgi:iron complex outermembrane receptor protein
MWMSERPRRAARSLWLLAGLCAGVHAQDTSTAALADLSLEQLRDIVVSTVSRRSERLDRVAASVFVITADDIRRSGATTLPEALRLAPSLQIARADANQYAISARGFNNVLANKMLVLIDGRTLYTPLFSGVFWESQDTMLEDVDRIEVITGPSAALWGTNAVNGLIHVFTRAAAATQGAAVSLSGSSRERVVAARYGGALGENGHFRVYAKSYDRSHTNLANGGPVRDQADGVQAGFRADWSLGADRLTLQGDAYRGSIDQAPAARRISGGNLLARWRREMEGGGTLVARLVVEQTERDHPTTFRQALHTVDALVQYDLPAAGAHRVLLGAGYRHSRDNVGNSALLAFLPAQKNMAWSRVFVQDQITLSPSLDLTFSASAEHNPYTDTELLPGARLGWRIDDRHMAWASLSRAVRAPSRIDREFFQPAQPPYAVAGGPRFVSETSDVAELGYRAQPTERVSYSVTLFHHEHRRLRSLAVTAGGLQFENDIQGHTRGLEAWGTWRVNERWKLTGGGTLLRQHLRVRPGGSDAGGLQALGNDPRHAWSLRSSFDLAPDLAWEFGVRRVGALPNPAVPAYWAADTRAAWRVSPELELALTAQNLFEREHVEWGSAASRAVLRRAVGLQLRWRL